MQFRRILHATGCAAAALLFLPAAWAAPTDILAIGSPSLTLSSTSVDFFSLGGPNTTQIGTSTGAFGPDSGDAAGIQNIGSVAVTNFISIPALPQAQFTLTSVGPGPGLICSGAVGLGQSCAIAAGSPFILTNTGTGTVISLAAAGTVTNSTSGAQSTFSGDFSTELPGRGLTSVAQSLLGGATITAPFSASLKVASGDFAGTLNIGLSTIALSATSVGFSSSNTIGPASTGGFAALSGSTAVLKNLTGGGPVSQFLTLTGLPNVQFTLTGVGPGLATLCSGVPASVGQTCSPVAGSPFVLVDTSTGTVVYLSAFGTTFDGISQSTFEAIFATEFPGSTLLQVAGLLETSAPVSGPFSVEFLAGPFASPSAVAEPGTLLLLGTMLVCFGAAGWRDRRI